MAHARSVLGPFTLCAGLVGAYVAVACAPILGIEDAICDPAQATCDPVQTDVGNERPPEGVPGGGNGGSAVAQPSGSVGGGGGNGGSAGGSGMSNGMAGAAGSGMAGGDMGPGGSGMEEPPEDPCPEYCAKIQEVCTEDSFQQYGSEATCLAYCALLPPGDLQQSPPERSNTVACRLDQLQLAELSGTELSTYCAAAGPGGNGDCGSNCESLCSVAFPHCTGFFASPAACRAQCEAIDDLSDETPPIHYVQNDVALEDGNHVQCRLYHLGAAMFDKQTHCPHVAGEARCVP